MKSRLAGQNCTIFDVLNATDFVVPALEILDTRIERVDAATKATRKIVDTIADNAANAGIVVGGRPFRPLDADMRWIGALCYRNGVIEETGLAAGVLNHPANGVAWLVRKLAALDLALEPRRDRALGLLHQADRGEKGRHHPGGLRRLRHGELSFRLSRCADNASVAGSYDQPDA